MRGRSRGEGSEEFWPAYTDIMMVTALILVLLVVTFVISRQDDSLARELASRKGKFAAAFHASLGKEEREGKIFLFSPPGERQTISFSDQLLFSVGDARLTRPEGLAMLGKVARLLGAFQGKKPLYKCVKVDGHTDETPIKTPLYPSNWHLSSARATSVVYQFVALGLPAKIFSATGYAEFQPLDPDGKLISSMARKRRIEIEVLYPLDWLQLSLRGKGNL